MNALSPDWAIVTVVTRNYLHFARALELSLTDADPDAKLFALVVDVPDQVPELVNERFSVMRFEDLGLKGEKRFLFQYTPFELTCALKSYALLHLFETTEIEKLLYFDGDIQIYGSLAPLLELLDKHNILLTPHLARPRSLAEPDRWEMDVVDTGVFNGGFIGIRRSTDGLAMLRWWCARMEKWCKWMMNHHDQGWLDAVPAMFEGVQIERGAQYNVAPWNLATRHIEENGHGGILVDGAPLSFFHFASIEPDQGQSLSRISRNPLAQEPKPVQRLYRDYVARLRQCGMEECRSWKYKYARLDDGTEMRPEWRELIRTNHAAFRDVENPFAQPAADYRRVATVERVKKQAQRVLRGFGLKA